jgi:hypothetical protein
MRWRQRVVGSELEVAGCPGGRQRKLAERQELNSAEGRSEGTSKQQLADH